MTGRTLRHYRLDAKIGEGGMGVVWRATDTHLDRSVAIKILPPNSAGPAARQRFIQEAKAASALNHPNIVTVYDADSADGVDFIAMELIEGKTLEDLIAAHLLPLRDTLKYATQIADALARAHAAGIVHRDLKPSNVMITRDSRAKILDFGLAKLTEPAAPTDLTASLAARPATEEGTILGTVAYMSPEQAEGRPIDSRSDIFSFGTMLYEMSTGVKPFRGETKLSVLSAILNQNAEPLHTRLPLAPGELDRIVNRCLRKDPSRRFQHIDEVKLALDDLCEVSESGRAPSIADRPQSNRRTWIAVAVIALALGAAANWMLTRGGPAPAPPPMTRITADAGLTASPAISPDGKLIAYASDRATGENLDLWVKHTGAPEVHRLTTDEGDETEPDFSPDGSRIAYRSTRGGGAIYVIPSVGGEPRLIARDGQRPRFSPDGTKIAYFVGALGAAYGTRYRAVFVADTATGASIPIAANLVDSAYPVWSPDGHRLIVLGHRSMADPMEWWSADESSTPAVPTGFAARFDRAKLTFAEPAAWTGGFVVFAAQQGDTTNLWRAPAAADGRAAGEPQRLTFGAAVESAPSVSPTGQIAFASSTAITNLWMLPVNANLARARGPARQLTSDAAVNERPMITPDGTKLAYASNRSGNSEIWLRDLLTGRDRPLTATPAAEFWSVIDAAGTKVGFSGPRVGTVASVIDLRSGVITELKRRGQVWDMTADGEWIIQGRRNDTDPPTLFATNISTQTSHPFTQHLEWRLLSPRFSRDQKFVVMHVRNSELTRQIFILPFHTDRETPQSEWIPVTDGKHLDRDPAWSPDGKVIYFLADRDGARGIAAQRLDPRTMRPSGPQITLFTTRGGRRSLLPFTNTAICAPTVAHDKIVFALAETTGNIWLTQLPKD